MVNNLYNTGVHTDQQRLLAVKELRKPEYRPVVEFLLSRDMLYCETLKKATNVEDIHRLQGRIAEVEDLLEIINS